MTGILRIRGTIDLDQFWPVGTSDADTTKILLTVDNDSFAFAANGVTYKKTAVFKTASIIGTGKSPVIKNNKVTIRLQGVDAPELHYKAGALRKSPSVTDKKRQAFNALNKHERRQYFAETATVSLFKKLKTFGKKSVPCEVYSFVDAPNEVADTYGRIVGNIRIGKKLDVNLWMLSEGYVYPAFYSSMSEDEINACLASAEKGRKKGRAWKFYSKKTTGFDWKLLYRKPADEPKSNAADDTGPVLMPKIFRRQVAYAIQRKVGLFKGSFPDYLRKSPDQCYQTDEFLEQGESASNTFVLADFFKGNVFRLGPGDLVFKEKPSKIVDAHNQPILKF